MKRAGFTLLEVMIAMAILSVSLTALFSTEGGVVKMRQRTEDLGIAALLARCKMLEIEEQTMNEGLPAVFDSGSDGCCEGAERDDYRCDWEIERITLPETAFAGGEEGEEADSPLTSLLGGGDDEESSPSDDPFAALQEGAVSPSSILEGGAMPMGGVGSLAMQFAYPLLKPAIEEQIRRATVTVTWREGTSGEHSFDVTQYLVADQPIAPEEQQEQEQQAESNQ